MSWFQSFLNEPGTSEGSSQRMCLFLLVVTVLALVTYLTVAGGKFPEIPATLQDLVQYLGSVLVLGIGFGKGTAAWQAVKAPPVPSLEEVKP